MVDTDELDKVLESNSIKSCPDDETIERVPKGHLDWLYQENARLAKINDDLREEIYSHVQWEKELNDDFTKITELANKVISLHRQIIMDYEGLLNAKVGITQRGSDQTAASLNGVLRRSGSEEILQGSKNGCVLIRKKVYGVGARRDGWSRPLPLGAPRPMIF